MMRRAGKYLLAIGGGICVLTLVVFVSTSGSKDEFEVIDTTPYVVWAALGSVVLILGAVFFAAGEVLRVLGLAPARDRVPVSGSHWD